MANPNKKQVEQITDMEVDFTSGIPTSARRLS